MLERNIQNCPKLLLSFSLLVKNKLILRRGFPDIKIYCNKASREISFLVKELSHEDHMLANKLQPHSVEITNEMRKSVRAV